MVFLHNNKLAFKVALEDEAGSEKASFWSVSNSWIEGKLKPLSLDDTTFDLWWAMSWEAFKFTVHGNVQIKAWEQLSIDSIIYVVRVVKVYDWTFEITKILLIKS